MKKRLFLLSNFLRIVRKSEFSSIQCVMDSLENVRSEQDCASLKSVFTSALSGISDAHMAFMQTEHFVPLIRENERDKYAQNFSNLSTINSGSLVSGFIVRKHAKALLISSSEHAYRLNLPHFRRK